MAKGTSDKDFLATLRHGESPSAPPPGRGMHLSKPPEAPSRPLEEVLAERGAEAPPHENATAPSPPPPAPVMAEEGAHARDMRFLPLSCLVVTKANSRVVRLPQRIHELMEALKADEHLVPAITVAPKHDEPTKFLVIDGQTRFMAAQQNGSHGLWAHVDHTIDTSSARAIYQASKKLNSQDQLKDIDRGLAWARLIADQEATLDDIAADEGLVKPTVTKMLVYSKLPAAILEVMQSAPERFPYTFAYQIHLLKEATDEPTALKLTNDAISNEMTRKQVESERQRLEARFQQGTVTRTRSSRIYHLPINLGGREVGTYTVLASKSGTGSDASFRIDGLDKDEIDLVSNTVTELIERLKAGQID